MTKPAGANKKDKASTTRCDQAGVELLPPFLRVRRDDVIDLHVLVCKSGARVYAKLDGRRLADEDTNELKVGPLKLETPEWHELIWAVIPTADEWQVVSELLVNGKVRFRHRKSNASEDAVLRWVYFVQVLS
jgi:hypothetical protein